MVQFSSLFNGLARNMSVKNEKKSRTGFGREAADALAKKARKNDLVLKSPGIINSTYNFTSTYSKKGKKGINQDCFIVWEEFGCQADMIFCGIFDGHGPWGHLVAKRVRKLMPSSLLCNLQETLSLSSLNQDATLELDRSCEQFNIWKQSHFKTCATIDQELQQRAGVYSFYSGTTALSVVRQGNQIIIANVGDSRAVLATISDDGVVVPVQLTVDFKPNLPQESERISQSNGKVFSAPDEPGVYRVWMPNVATSGGPGLAISRAFGDYYIKDFGLTSEPDVSQRSIKSRDQFVILATDGVWDVITNQEAVEIVFATPEKEESAKRLVESAVCAWKRKRRGMAMDDISAICLFFHPSSPLQLVERDKHSIA